MNVHAPKTADIKFKSWTFRGKPFNRFGKRWLRAKHRTMSWHWFYCFEDDQIYDQAYSSFQ